MASDMRLNDKPIAKDGAYIYAETADGSQVKISKADLASVVAGIMGFLIYSKVINIGESVTLNKGYGILIIDNITTGNSAVYGIANGKFDLLSSKDETMITISQVSEHEISLTNTSNVSVTIQARIL